MNNIKKLGLTALAGSLIATSAFAGSMSVSGGADIALKNESNHNTSNSFSSGDSLTFTGSGELDNGLTITSKVEIDGGAEDDRSVVIASEELGTLTFSQSGDSAMSAVDDVMPTAYDSSWDVIAQGHASTTTTPGQATKDGAIGGFATNNMFFYTLPEMVDGLGVNVSYVPSATGRPDGTTSFALAYTGVEGLTIGYAQDDNGLSGTSKLETETYYAKYAFGSFTVGVQESEQDQAGATTSDDDMSIHGITYQVNDDITIGYHAATRDLGDKGLDEESKSLQVAYTQGGMTIKAQSVSMDNVGGSSAARDDIDGYKVSVSFAF